MSPETRERIVQLSAARQRLLDELRDKPSGLAWCSRHTELADEVVRVLYNDLRHSQPELPGLAIIATGGYGRSELSPHSDIDITIVPSDEASGELDNAIRVLFQDLHWAFCTEIRLDVGYAYRPVSDSPGLDAKTRTGLMDMRHLAGSFELTRALDESLLDSFSAGEFLLSKITEREEMFSKHHDTPYVIEPNLKEGAGGLRCFHCANWLREAIGERAARPDSHYDLIVRYRNLLHLIAGRHLDVLSRQRQSEIADLLGIEPFAMMPEIVASGASLHNDYRRSTEKIHEARFRLSRGVLSVQGEAREVGNVDGGEASVGIAIATQLGLRVSDIPFGPTIAVSGPAASFALTTGEATIRNLDRCGLLERILPALSACRTLIPSDSVHTYTVFEHTLRVVRQLDRVGANPFLGEIKETLTDLEPLYLAALLHDVGKIDPERAHSEYGAEIAEGICASWGLAENVSEHVCWLVLEHLTMARFIRVRDIMNPQTVAEFAAIVGDLERLRMLTLLTWADISAVSDSSWTPAQETFLRDLFERTQATLQGDVGVGSDVAVYRQRLLRHLKREFDEEKVQEFLNSLPAYYLTSTPADVVRLHMDFAKRATKGEPTVELFHRADISATELTVCAKDMPGLLNRLLGVFYAFDLSVSGIRACTTATSPPIALDVFTVSFGGRPIPSATMKQVSAGVLDVISGAKNVLELLTSRGKDPARQQNVYSYVYVEGSPGILEVRAPRGRGMPFRLSRFITEQGWNVISARVGQWAGNATAAFYILGPQGEPLMRQHVEAAMATVGTHH